MGKFVPLVIALLLMGLFAIAIISGGIMLANQNGANQSIGDDPSIAAYAAIINDTLQDSYENANSSLDSLSKSAVTLTSGFPVFDAISGLWKTLKTAPITIYNFTLGFILENLLGSTAYGIVLGTLSAILLIIFIFAVWRMVSTGDGG